MLLRMASVHAPVHQHDVLHRRRDADARAQAGFGLCNSFIGSGTAFSAKSKRLKWTIIVIWDEGQDDPWILTDIEPMEAGASWYEMRFWIETGFNALKSVGWQRQKTRRTNPAKVERHWLVLSVSTLLTLATGSRVEDANALKRDPSALRAAKSRAGAQSSRERISPWLVDAEPPSGKGQDAAPRAAAARTVAAPAWRREGGLPPRNPKPAPVSP